MELTAENISWVIGIVGAVSGAAIYVTKSLYVKKIDGLNNDLAEREKQSGELKRSLENREKEIESLKKTYDSMKVDFTVSPQTELGARLLKEQVDDELESLVREVRASSGSVYIPADRLSGESGLRFLSMYPGDKFTPSLRRRIVPFDSLAGECFQTGKPNQTGQDTTSAGHYQAFDTVTAAKTRTTLNIPLKVEDHVVGVIQFINKEPGDQAFSPADEEIVQSRQLSLAEKVDGFTSNPDNIQTLGIVKTYKAEDATVMFCDLTESTRLFTGIENPSWAIQCLNEYLDLACEVALKHGATIDKYIGDSVMLTFNVPKRIPDHRKAALKTAIKIEEGFETLKSEWVGMDKNKPSIFESIFSRISIGTGDVYFGMTGHTQKKSLTIFGAPVIASMCMCETASRDSNVIVFDEKINDVLPGGARTETITGKDLGKAAQFIHKGYKLLNRDFI